MNLKMCLPSSWQNVVCSGENFYRDLRKFKPSHGKEERGMKRFLSILLCSIIATLGIGPVNADAAYSVVRLTNNSYQDYIPDMNDNGDVVWKGNDGSDLEIFLYDGSTTTQLTNNSYHDQGPRINDNGYVVWYGEGNLDPGDPSTDNEIFLYDGSTTIQLTDNSHEDRTPRINDYGHVVWSGFDDSDYEIFFYDGTTIIQITNNSYYDNVGRINESGYVAWRGELAPTIGRFLLQGQSLNPRSPNLSPPMEAMGWR
jgi:Tol biopolymer transport system component